jgi:hypothetical protein
MAEKSMRHTPGPWRPGRADKSYDAGIPDNAFAVFAMPEHRQDCGLQGNAAVICVIAKPERMTEEDIANARLIVAAPAMLEELSNAIDVLAPQMSRHEIVELRERLIRFQSSIQVV